MSEDELWKSFNLAKANEDPGGGILYCLRYSPDKINAMQETVIGCLKKAEVEMVEFRDSICAKIPKSQNQNRIYLLLEELSVINEAKEWIDIGYGSLKSISDLTNHLITMYHDTLDNNGMSFAYEFVSRGIPDMCRDIYVAQKQNNILSKKEKKQLDSLISFAKRQEEILNTNGKYPVFGNSLN